MKPKQNAVGDKSQSMGYDQCQTPFYALDPLIPYLSKKALIWEPAQGDGHIVTKLTNERFAIVGTDILSGHNFFEYEPVDYDCQVTNPPYSIKYDWLRRSYELGKPFALLIPLESLGAAKGQRLFEKYGVEIILFDKRVNFKMPHRGYSGAGAQFPTAWFTWGLEIGQQITYGKIHRYEDQQLSILDAIKANKMRYYGKFREKVEVTGLSINENRTFIKYQDGSTRCVNSKDLYK